jgi:hypothetical protein
MAKQVTRTIKTFTINAATVKAINGKIETTPIAPIFVEDETVTQENAVKFVQKANGKKEQYVILSIEEDAKTYAVPFDVFMSNAKVLEKVEHTEAETAANSEAVAEVTFNASAD